MPGLEDLRAELDAGHPGTGAYNTDAQVASDELNAVNRTKNRAVLTGDDVFATTEASAFAALTGEDKQLWMSFCGRDQLDPFGAANVAFVISLFTGGSATVAALNAARRENVSRARELGFSTMRPGLVLQARAL